MNALTTCVDYDDYLERSLPKNRRHFDRYLVVTTYEDLDTRALAAENGCEVHCTRAFYKNGAAFNKFLAMEEGLDALGREGWLCFLDADTVLPAALSPFERPALYTPRRVLECGTVDMRFDWHFGGYCQIFHAEDAGPPPWHPLDLLTAGGGDTAFQRRFKVKRRPEFLIQHLGPIRTNWRGRVSPRCR